VILSGIGVSEGRCSARVYLYDNEPATEAVGADGSDLPATLLQLETALHVSREELVRLESEVAERVGADTGAIFAAQRLVLEDSEWLDPVRARIAAGQPASRAVWETSQEIAAELRLIEDDYLRERATDVVDVAKRVLQHLGCATGGARPRVDGGQVVLVARELTPSDTVDLDPSVVVGIATETGARTSHAAILARQLAIPAVVGVAGLLNAAEHADTIALDGDSGQCELDPSAERAREFSRRAGAEHPVVSEQVSTIDGEAVAVCANVSSAAEVEEAVGKGADGVGLFRTEFLFLRSGGLPSEDEQAAAYCEAAEAAGGRPLVFRALDVGADKSVPGLALQAEDNPFLGLRGIRLLLKERAVFDTQLRAMIRTAELHPNISLMLPMVSGPEELQQARRIVGGLGGSALRLGTMIEVPSAALLARQIAPHADFFSVGSNDLTGYVLAVDRTNPRLGDFYDELHPAVIRLLQAIATAAAELRTPLSLCGELAGDPLALPLLIGLGYRSVSVAPSLLPRVKAAIRSISAAEARELALRAASSVSPAEVRDAVRKAAP
jgi:phosphoenolpyruvate-protein phosphotransferase (PTS system enzyme I)